MNSKDSDKNSHANEKSKYSGVQSQDRLKDTTSFFDGSEATNMLHRKRDFQS